MQVDNCYVTADQNAPKDPRTDFPDRFGNWSKAQLDVGIKGMLVCQWVSQDPCLTRLRHCADSRIKKGVHYSSPTGLQGPASWTPSIATSYRVSDDIATGWSNVLRIMNEAIHVNLNGLSGPGHFADMVSSTICCRDQS